MYGREDREIPQRRRRVEQEDEPKQDDEDEPLIARKDGGTSPMDTHNPTGGYSTIRSKDNDSTPPRVVADDKSREFTDRGATAGSADIQHGTKRAGRVTGRGRRASRGTDTKPVQAQVENDVDEDEVMERRNDTKYDKGVHGGDIERGSENESGRSSGRNMRDVGGASPPRATSHQPRPHPPRGATGCCHPLISALSSCFSFLGTGFRLDMASGRVVDLSSWKRVCKSPGFLSVENTSLCIRLGGLSNLQALLATAVKPFIKIHVLHLETGCYLTSLEPRSIPIPPLTSRQAHLAGSVYDVPNWDEEIVIPHAAFRNLVHPDSLILFELLDDPPSLSFRSIQTANDTRSTADPGKTHTKLAWAFLLPVGQRVNVGYPQRPVHLPAPTEDISSHGVGAGRHRPPPKKSALSRRKLEDKAISKRSKEATGDGDDECSDGDDDGSKSDDMGGRSERTRRDPSDDTRRKHGEFAGLGSEDILATSSRPPDPWIHDVDLTLQLYAYQNDNISTRIQRNALGWPLTPSGQNQKKTETSRFPDSIPEVYLQYRRTNLKQLRTTMDIRAGYRHPPRGLTKHGEAGDAEGLPGGLKDDDEPRVSQAAEDLAKTRLRAAILKRSRALNEPCVIPNKVLHRLNVGHEGAMVVQFSHSGHLLAVACAVSVNQMAAPSMTPVGLVSPFAGPPYALKLYDPDTGLELWSDLIAHHGVIYDLKWSMDDCFVLSCSSDGQCKVWQVSDVRPAVEGDSFLGSLSAYDDSCSFCVLDIETLFVGFDCNGLSGAQRRRSSAGFHQNYHPRLVSTMLHGPPVFVYAAIFQEYPNSNRHQHGQEHPRVITGSHDGRIRVWQGQHLLGDLTIGASGNRSSTGSGRRNSCGGDRQVVGIAGVQTQRPELSDVPHMGFMVQALAIDIRTKYMFSGDSGGSILIWRPDGSEWYQMLRPFKKDDLVGRSISSISIFPNRAKGHLLVLALPSLHSVTNSYGLVGQTTGHTTSPAEGGAVPSMTTSMLKLYDLGTLRALHTFNGANITGSFCRATFSADGRYAISGVVTKTAFGIEKFTVQLWDVADGSMDHSDLTASMCYPYIARCVSWHPHQHMFAVAVVGSGASVGIYSANKAGADVAARPLGSVPSDTDLLGSSYQNCEDTTHRKYSDGNKLTPAERLKLRLSNRGARPKSSPGRPAEGKGLLSSPRRKGNDTESADDAGVNERLKDKKAARTMEILEKIKAAKARKQSVVVASGGGTAPVSESKSVR